MIAVEAQTLLSDATGIINRFEVQRGSSIFEISVVANFDAYGINYHQDKQVVNLYIDSSLNNNIGEMILPLEVLDGKLDFLMDGQPYEPVVNSADDVYFIVLNFTGTGEHELIIRGENASSSEMGGGCLIATAAYGTELGPQIQFLREIRDKNIMNTDSGSAFMTSFNQIYYSFSPTVADWERQNPIFREVTKLVITPMIMSLYVLEHADTEPKLITLGLVVILANIGMYVGLPVMGTIIYRHKSSRCI